MTETQKLQNFALKYLSIRARSKKEVQVYLEKKSQDMQAISQVIIKLENIKLIDDTAFATWYIQSRSRSRPSSAWLLARELKEKGIDKQMVEDIEKEPEDLQAEKALAKKLPRLSSLPWQEFRSKAGRFLASRGFNMSTIEKVLKKSYNRENVTDSF